MTSQAGMISAGTKAVLAAAKRRGVKLGRDPWGSIDGQGTSNWVGNGCAAGNGRRAGGPARIRPPPSTIKLRSSTHDRVDGKRSTSSSHVRAALSRRHLHGDGRV